jgi:hypothetical protein
VSQARFQKQQREKARREKAAAKWARRQERRSDRDDAPPSTSTSASEEAEVLTELAALHARFESGEIPFDDFVTAKEELTQRLDVR